MNSLVEDNTKLQMIVIVTLRLNNDGNEEYYLESGDGFELKTSWKPMSKFDFNDIKYAFYKRVDSVLNRDSKSEDTHENYENEYQEIKDMNSSDDIYHENLSYGNSKPSASEIADYSLNEPQLNDNQCKICGKVYESSDYIAQHLLIHSLITSSDLEDDYSENQANDEIISANNESTRKKQTKTFKCDLCLKSYTSAYQYNKHLRNHVNAKYQCSFCQKKFVTQSEFIKHESTHLDADQFKCPICHVQLSCSYNVRRHLLQHKANQPYKCGFCDQSFSNKNKLAVHKTIHTGKQLFTCEVCKVKVTSKSNLEYHMQMHERGFRCRFCGKCFSHQANLTRHQIIHKGTRNFECQHCFAKFVSVRNLQVHIDHVHETKL